MYKTQSFEIITKCLIILPQLYLTNYNLVNTLASHKMRQNALKNQPLCQGVSGPFWKIRGTAPPKSLTALVQIFCKTYKKMYESREKMRVDEIVDQVVGRSWLQGCPNICAATHFHARSSSSGRLDVRSL